MNHQNTNQAHSNHHANHAEMFKQKFFISLLFTIPIVLLSQLENHLFGVSPFLNFPGQQYLNLFLSSVLMWHGGVPFFNGMMSEFHKRQPGMMTLISLAISVAYFYSSAIVFGLDGMPFFWELATLISMMLFGHWIEMSATMSAGNALQELVQLLPQQAHKIDQNGVSDDVDLEQINPGDLVLIKPGEKIPVDGLVLKGDSFVNESLLTGESMPVKKTTDSKVIGGSINQLGSLKIKVSKTGQDSFLSQIISLVKQAQDSKSKLQNLADRVAFWLTISALSISILTFVFWAFFTPEPLAFAIARAVTVLVIACPHALGVAIPLVVAISTSIAAKNGFLIRNRTSFELAGNINAVIFDKTGTLTEGKFGVVDIVTFEENYDSALILKLAKSVETNSQHPIATSILKYRPEIEASKIQNFQSITGKGVSADFQNKHILLVSPGYLSENNQQIPESATKLIADGKTVVFLIVNKLLVGCISLADTVRQESKYAITKLKELGIAPIMLTGDNKNVAQSVSTEIGIDQYFAEVSPEQKVEIIKKTKAENQIVAMVGDGINDAPALAASDIGIAVGAGTDIAVQSADLVLVKNNPMDVVNIILLAKKNPYQNDPKFVVGCRV
jgi:Cu2+-exporting ATPase